MVIPSCLEVFLLGCGVGGRGSRPKLSSDLMSSSSDSCGMEDLVTRRALPVSLQHTQTNTETTLINNETNLINTEINLINTETNLINTETNLINTEINLINTETTLINNETNLINTETLI